MYNMQLIKWRPKKEREKERKEEGKGPERRGGRKRKETDFVHLSAKLQSVCGVPIAVLSI